ncbi:MULTISPECIES: glycoside hydrolase family 15 protein [unclassified Robiginitalea]|uniref:glycoside hydrolase family 15 protein n=1 Tax=Robiginitalea TaxID=252306 RepID=UPI002349ACE5|nr:MULTISPECIES: glycoside hydrolase family 15 protein [unclassified Robiginitalea]MDC6355018.1 glycoside hydrolase family 15 protein [Robiginitalea sp. PM2]MDC6375285.1 glycoside hydrolase family 15 protein [Robiginitalea sp. SP8]
MDNLDYGIIGNCRSAALVSKNGSLDWCCLPEFDSSSVFAKILDKNKGGSFSINTGPEYEVSQRYKKDTALLITRYADGDNIFEVRDFMPRYHKENGIYHAPPEIIRYIRHIKGRPVFSVSYDPKLEYGLGLTETFIKKSFIASVNKGEKYDTVFLYTSFNKNAVMEGRPLELKKDGFFLLSYNEKLFKPTTKRMYLELERTKVYWLNWSNQTPLYREYNDQIQRSAVTLKLLSYDRSGAILAAATTSLPETIGETRNWDYRFCWIRDASMVVKVVSELGHKNVARRYLRFIVDLIPDKDEKLQIMYGINKEKRLTEITLDHLDGYEGSRPVRVGNAAYKQRQNDIYGILMDVIYAQLVRFKNDLEHGEELWTLTKGIVWIVQKHWKEPDKGIWEFRTEDRHFTFSKVLCWVAIDRAIKIARIFRKQRKIERWTALEQEIKRDIHENAWNEEVQAFTQSYGSFHMDASVLLMESYGFIHARDPKFVSTVKAVETHLSHEGLLYRYRNEDDFGLPSSSFTICTFWFINSLFKIGEEDRARELFDQLLSYSNHLGLFSEDIDFKSKRLLGNFPQAYSHLALIECAINFSRKDSVERVLETMQS